MYLSQLEVVGFKSFAQKVKFKFNQGISAVVGPNGCGKTNVVDAIRWALGEQKSAVLRSEVMDNVIFNGAKGRKPLGMAEVSLVIQNNRGVLPSEYSEVTLTRRIFRDGESEYLINNTKCRLRDILDLFMDTGMGSDSYSVIELKMVEAILSGRPEERRHLIEEAAGVNKYKLRRREATRKLQNIQSDLTRVQDIVQEVEKLVNSLARQASKTKKYNKLFERHKELEVALLLIDFKDQRGALDNFENEIKEIIAKRIEQETDLHESEEFIKELSAQLTETDSDYQIARDTENSINKEIAQKNKDIAVSKERLNSIENAQYRIEKDINEANAKSAMLGESIAAAKDRLNEYQENHSVNIEEAKIAKELRDSVFLDVKESREEANYANEDALKLQNALNSAKNSLFRNKSRKENLEGLLDRNTADIEKVNKEIDSLLGQKAEAELEAENLKTSLDEAEIEYREAQEKQNALKAEIENQKSKLSERKNEYNSKKASLDFLSTLADSDESAKFLLNQSNWKTDFEKTILIEAVGADEKFRIAIESALGVAAHSFIVNDLNQAKSAFEILSRSNKGKATFICKQQIPSASPLSYESTDEKIYGVLSELVRCEDEIRNFLRILLSNTLIVEDLETAENLVKNSLAEAAVTLKGEIIRKDGFSRGGGVLKSEGQTVGKNERINILKSEMQELLVSIQEIENEIKYAKEDLDLIDLRALSEAVKQAEAAIAKNERLCSQFAYKADALENNIKAFEQNKARYEEELAQIRSEEENFQSEIDKIDSKLALAKEELKARMAKVQKEEGDLRKAEENLKLAEMNRIKIEAQISAAKNEIARNEQDIINIANKINNLTKEISENESDLVRINETISGGEIELDGLNTQYDEAKNRRQILAEQKAALDEQISQYNSGLSQKRKQFERTIEVLHQVELKTSETKANIKNMLARAVEDLEIDLENPEVEPIEIESIPEAKNELADVKSKLSSLGNVNFMALEEFEAQTKRFSFYQEQLTDLTDSEKTLRETIEEINDTAEKKFRDTFDLVNDNFKMLFKKLFNDEAESELKLNGDSILDCDIEIIAKPPGKKPHSIEMLSQGEKTLTAIALLFGIYLVKPSPFCILDEVDAPLDDMNIDRFLGMIKQFSKETQFLMVTHNKKTMTAADTLYGITMHEEGVSKVVSVKLAADQEPLLV
jgi:chromosome segregation protein